MEWFRLYDDLVHNAKAQSLPPILFKHWVNLLCLASKNKENRGWLPSIDRVSFALRMRPERAKAVIQSLVRLGFLSQLGQVHDWIQCQRESDNSAVRKQVQRNKDIVKNVTGQSRDKTASDTDTEQIQIQNRTDTERTGKPLRGLCGQFCNVKLSEDELTKLADKFGEPESQKRIETLSEYIASKGKKYSSHYATILAWDRKNGANGNGKRQYEFETRAEAIQRKNEQAGRDALNAMHGGARERLGGGDSERPDNSLPEATRGFIRGAD